METATSTASEIAVELNPVPGFCAKSRAENDHCRVRIADEAQAVVPVKQGDKIFVNVAWDNNIPPPPHADDDTDSFVPIVVSDARQDSDKAGHPALVFDCVLHPSIKSRCLKNPDFKTFITELAFQRIEAHTGLLLSRQIALPNISSKGKPRPRRVLVSASLYPPGHPNHRPPPPLIQEIPSRSTGNRQPKSILKIPRSPIPAWSWSQQDSRIRFVFNVPGATRALISESTLDVESRRVLLHVPTLYDFDLDLDAPDSALASINAAAEQVTELKRMRSLDIENARAEWRVADNAIVLLV